MLAISPMLFVGAMMQMHGFVIFLPIDDMLGQIYMVFLFAAVGQLLATIIIGFYLGPFLLSIHKKFVGKKMEYGIQKKNENEIKVSIKTALFPGFLAVGFALVFAGSESFINSVFNPAFIGAGGGPSMVPFFIFLACLSFTAGISMALYVPIWFLKKAQIVYTKKKDDESDPTEIKSVGGFYINLLKGYAGISVILSLYMILYYMMIGSYAEGGINGIFVSIPPFFALPFILILLCILAIPSLILIDLKKESIINRIIEKAEKLNIAEPVDIKFEK